MKRTLGTYKYEHALADAFNFTEEDLIVNQRGEVTPHQIEILIQKRNQNRWGTLFLGIIFTLVTLGLFLVLLIIPPIRRWFLKEWRALEQDIQTLEVEGIEGIVNLDIHRSTHKTTQGNATKTETRISYNVQIGPETFSVSEQAFLAFKNGDPYAFYLARHSRTILSIDWLRDDNPFMEETE